MNVRFLGNVASPLTLDLARQLGHRNDLSIDALTYTTLSTSEASGAQACYRRVEHTALPRWALGVRAVSRAVQACVLSMRLIFSRPYDVCHIHYLLPLYGTLAPLIASRSRYVFATFWGSDFYRSSARGRARLRRLLRRADRITFANESMYDAFVQEFGSEFDDRVRITRFGLSVLDKIDALGEVSRSEVRARLGLPDDVTLVTCGYNSDPGQQHLAVIRSLAEAFPDGDDRIFCLFPLTYGPRSQVDVIRHATSTLPLAHRVITGFLPEEEIALLRRAGDVMIHVPVSDQLSGSMQEALYAGQSVITGDWLPYDVLVEAGTRLELVHRPQEVGPALRRWLEGRRPSKEELRRSAAAVRGLSSWGETITGWSALYDEVVGSARVGS